jgi:predicted NAD-dependent protein-ADP-ribosyltransferase YbiA (DUF1768 family)
LTVEAGEGAEVNGISEIVRAAEEIEQSWGVRIELENFRERSQKEVTAKVDGFIEPIKEALRDTNNPKQFKRLKKAIKKLEETTFWTQLQTAPEIVKEARGILKKLKILEDLRQAILKLDQKVIAEVRQHCCYYRISSPFPLTHTHITRTYPPLVVLSSSLR